MRRRPSGDQLSAHVSRPGRRTRVSPRPSTPMMATSPERTRASLLPSGDHANAPSPRHAVPLRAVRPEDIDAIPAAVADPAAVRRPLGPITACEHPAPPVQRLNDNLFSLFADIVSKDERLSVRRPIGGAVLGP